MQTSTIRTFFVTIISSLFFAQAMACTGIVIKSNDGATIPARTMEFGFDVQSNIYVVPAGATIEKLYMDDKHQGGTYKAKYGFAGANALGKPIVVDGVNEKGLYFGAFYFANIAEFTPLTKDNQKEAISSEELGNYILSQFASVAEVKKALPDLIIVGTHIQEINSFAPFHYAISDATGESIVVEITKDGLKIFDNTVNVVTNNPTYDWHLTNLNNYVGLTPDNQTSKTVSRQKVSPFGQGTGLFGLPGDHTSPSRFVRATAFVNTYKEAKTSDEAVFNAFHILNHFDIPKGSIRENINGDVHTDYTVWTSVVDTKHPTYYFKTYLTQQVEKVDLLKALKNLKAPKTIVMESGFSIKDRTND
ncbi:choloylglycine hydrolase [Veronia nyctiphanis]|uniref:Choloylglycine hydrolase n=1 Tax=Veronia nyctiphanis TaxID=1278244 RepID=A0A4V1LT73_9GAMM|nr:choloylglycine hydrolase family protein [Veronia nyctiphanis]RXJ74198.1 choloylglycine hydrolase [Veronia nyctiphanis]